MSTKNTNFFTGRLAAELRLEIYRHALASDVPLKLQHRGVRKDQLSTSASLLSVCRLIRTEAEPIFYDVNTFSAARADFCSYAIWNGLSRARRQMVQHLLISDLSPATSCQLRFGERIWQIAYSPKHCGNCVDSSVLLPLNHFPSLHTATFDVSKVYGSFDAMTSFGFFQDKAKLRTLLTQTGIGEWTLGKGIGGSLIFDHQFWKRPMSEVEVTFVLKTWVTIWTELWALPPRSLNTPQSLRVSRRMLKLDEHIAKRVLRLITFHDEFGVMPEYMSVVWPQDVPKDLRLVGSFDRPATEYMDNFFSEFNMAFWTWLYRPGQKMVSRRA